MQRAKDDIAHLYQEFGGTPQNYRELASTREAERARDRWPLISRVEDLSDGATVPPVRAGEDPTAEPLRWLAGAPAVHPPAQTQVAAGRIEPTLTPPQAAAQPLAGADAPLPWAQPSASQAPALEGAAPANPEPRTPGAMAASAPAPLWEPSRPAQPPAAAPATAAGSAAMAAAGSAGMFASLRGPAAQAAAPAAPSPVPWAPPAARAADPWQSPRPPIEPASWGQPPAALHQPAHAARPAQPALEGRSPLARLAQPEPSPAPRAGGLHNLFARLLGRDGP